MKDERGQRWRVGGWGERWGQGSSGLHFPQQESARKKKQLLRALYWKQDASTEEECKFMSLSSLPTRDRAKHSPPLAGEDGKGFLGPFNTAFSNGPLGVSNKSLHPILQPLCQVLKTGEATVLFKCLKPWDGLLVSFCTINQSFCTFVCFSP